MYLILLALCTRISFELKAKRNKFRVVLKMKRKALFERPTNLSGMVLDEGPRSHVFCIP